MCFRNMDEFIGKDEAFVKDWLVRQGLEKSAEVFRLLVRGDINISDKVNYSLFITVKTVTNVNTA